VVLLCGAVFFRSLPASADNNCKGAHPVMSLGADALSNVTEIRKYSLVPRYKVGPPEDPRQLIESKQVRQMQKSQRMHGANFGRYLRCALVCMAMAGCGGGSDSTSPETSQNGSVPVQTAATSGTPATPAPPPAPAPPGSGTNSPATISGTPGTQAQAGQAYSFTPTVTGSVGTAVTFSVQNKPTWASFNTSSGQLSGTPTNAQAGSYANIVISMSDGTSSQALAPFSITVTAQTASTGTATLSWVAPAKNTDGSPVTNLAGFKIDYGNSAGALTQTVSVSDPAATSYTIQGLTSGTWYFAVSDFTSAGVASALSAVVTKTIQ
jgi:hypothetical protein